jgi:DNA primase
MHRERKIIALRKAVGDDGWQKGDEIAFFCPKHEHHKRKLMVNISNDKFHCWVCGWGGGTLMPILSRLPPHDELRLEYAEGMKKSSSKTTGKVYETVRLPSEFRPLSEARSSPYYRQAIAYLTDRGITSDDILLYKLGYCEDGPYAYRIIIPSFDEYGMLNFFTGRAMYQADLKYKHGVFDKDIIFNDLLIDWLEPVTLVEGPIDAIKAGFNAIPLQGKRLRVGSKLFDKIVHRKGTVYVALDSDAWEDAFNIMSELTKYGVDVNYVKLEGFKDPGDMTKEQMDELRRQAVKVHPSGLMRMKLMHDAFERRREQ